ncbi:MAG: hypothetical protein A3C08_00480 [Candidatus Taylorbacteria bacterium RIFCSPHIGHO2_02_FULL_47_18]|uniref:Uncharacterized protein n=1 Tax=Candidatus Taylorbacteria bacterium RIFCSPLOWO2_01_FULL_48_100 TaxID=1802322 RepID=A0A1G2NH32_9BACT|nr:MAG: hypothetical protein A2670_00195 [Candidatus Taylorbacteria bacterium RIFCSPHIGHO2_01_FULL_48_38]OHA27835.1 MAG: hypothetical protein A3C08_00480 [Candidatus Taylorbacteria bacterium RIFCSPHIGHO2_02_FULL_47_18]OHA34769.1 MAG: hypothetical protein A2938_03630 [Candidatus Taylorbacteria bacterium RIFCSPLOWO2_01_FULL_48_100]OHA40922.1 MAG: hypothetical protein A3J31_03925 [Candidatus Taylorbacteria bacterium RIFCSPLOWO2_02_FULL_48_16]OHA45068.1 MAG: hypothetical protein A3H13_02650 [Candid
MKIAVFAALLSVASAMAQQYLLPIGSNVNNRQSEVSIVISALDTWARLEDTFSFYPYMGDFEDVIKNRVKVLAERYVPPLGFEQGEFALNVQATPGPYSQNIFRLQQSDGKWAVPPEVLDVKLQYGEVTLNLTGVTKVELRVRGNGREERFSSDGSSPGSACFIQTVDRELGQGLVILAKEYVNPQYREEWITEGEVVLWENGLFAEFNIIDGFFSSASANLPKLLESIRAPETQSQQSQSPVLVVSSPKIARITRIGSITEITVSVEATSVANIEFSGTLNGNWYSIPKYLQPLNLQTGSTKFTHTTEAPASFYRVRLAESQKQ